MDPVIERMLDEMKSMEIVKVKEPSSGTQLKLFVTLRNGALALLKPLRFDRQQSLKDPNQFYFSEFERANAEIAAFHLDKVMGFNRVPPTVGRRVNLTREIEPIAPLVLKQTIFTSPIGNRCFHGNCDYYCDTGHAICGKPHVFDASFQATIPMMEDEPRIENASPWRRSYSKFYRADWEYNPFYCDSMKRDVLKNRTLLDIIDVSLFDFLTGNQDRHHFDTFKRYGDQSAPILFDNGRAYVFLFIFFSFKIPGTKVEPEFFFYRFGLPDFDDETILAPLNQCCLLRYSTLERLLQFQNGPDKLSELFHQSTTMDPLYPLVHDDFLTALDRRLVIILKAVRTCIWLNDYQNVIFDDGL